jgi:hypothetical protein
MKAGEMIRHLMRMPNDMEVCYAAWVTSERGSGYQYRTPKKPEIKIIELGEHGKRVAIMESHP